MVLKEAAAVVVVVVVVVVRVRAPQRKGSVSGALGRAADLVGGLHVVHEALNVPEARGGPGLDVGGRAVAVHRHLAHVRALALPPHL